jgi:ParB-like chromosome segregation protein Spo0J
MVHPATALFPMMNDAELKELAESIKLNGLLQPVVLNFDESILIDGRNRLRACEMAGADTGEDYLVTETWGDENTTEEQTLNYIVAANVQRRHLTKGQKAMLAADLEPMYAAAMTVGRPRKGEEKIEEDLPQFSDRAPQARDQAAAAVGGVSGRSVGDAKALKEEAPDLAEKVSSRDMTLNAATKERKARKQKPKANPRPKLADNPVVDELVKDELAAAEAESREPSRTAVTGKAHEAGVKISEQAIRIALERERGRNEGAAETPPLAWDTIPGNQREKLDKAKASIRRELEKEFRTRLLAELDQYRAQCDANVAAYKAKLEAEAERERAARDEERRRYRESIDVYRAKGLITPDEYSLIRACLHPDSRNSVTDERLAAAFRLFNDSRIKILLVKEV